MAAASASFHSPTPRASMAGSIRRDKSACAAARLGLLTKRGSSAKAGRPMTAQKLRNCESLPTATIRWPSRQAKARNGAVICEEEPMRAGSFPLAR
ncbi:hypothetical protein D3C78_1760200 [compost metagenome]